MKNSIFIALLVVGVGIACFSSAATIDYTWTGGVSADWNTAGNWDINGVPVDQDAGQLGLNGDMTVILDGATAPSVNVPVLGAHSSATRNTPRIQMNQGTMTLTPKDRMGWWIIGNNEILTVGNGVDAASLTLAYSDASLNTFTRTVTGGQVNTVDIRNNGTLNITVIFGMAGDVGSSTELSIRSGGTVNLDGGLLNNRWGGASWIGLENGATMTMHTDGHYKTVAALEGIYGSKLLGLGGATLVTTLDGTTLTVTAVPEPATLGLVGIAGGAILIIRRRYKI